MNCNLGLMGQIGRGVLLTLLSLFVLPTSAHAHLMNTGFGPFYDGVTHLMLSPDDLLVVVGIALLAGLFDAQSGRVVLFTMPVTWFMGGLFGLQMETEIILPVVNTLSFLVVGVLVAADIRKSVPLIGALALGLGLLHGFLNGTAMAQTNGGILSMTGIVAAVFVIISFLAAFVVSVRVAWQRVAVRVAGSWIAAIGILMLGWAYRGVVN